MESSQPDAERGLSPAVAAFVAVAVGMESCHETSSALNRRISRRVAATHQPATEDVYELIGGPIAVGMVAAIGMYWLATRLRRKANAATNTNATPALDTTPRVPESVVAHEQSSNGAKYAFWAVVLTCGAIGAVVTGLFSGTQNRSTLLGLAGGGVGFLYGTALGLVPAVPLALVIRFIDRRRS